MGKMQFNQEQSSGVTSVETIELGAPSAPVVEQTIKEVVVEKIVEVPVEKIVYRQLEVEDSAEKQHTQDELLSQLFNDINFAVSQIDSLRSDYIMVLSKADVATRQAEKDRQELEKLKAKVRDIPVMIEHSEKDLVLMVGELKSKVLTATQTIKKESDERIEDMQAEINTLKRIVFIGGLVVGLVALASALI